MWLHTYLRNFIAIFQGNPRPCAHSIPVCLVSDRSVYVLEKRQCLLLSWVLWDTVIGAEVRLVCNWMICLKNVVLYGWTWTCTLVTVPLSFNFTCLELAALEKNAYWPGDHTYLRVSSCQAVSPTRCTHCLYLCLVRRSGACGLCQWRSATQLSLW